MRHRGRLFIWIGLILLSVSLILALYNFITERSAGNSAARVYDQIVVLQREENKIDLGDKIVEPTTEDLIVEDEDFKEIPDYILNPNMEMPTVEIDGYDYIGLIEIPSLELSLPVVNGASSAELKAAPGRYSGSVYTNDMVIAAHNYASHFGTIKNISLGDMVVFTDMDGNVFSYQVLGIELLGLYDVDNMISGSWDLTLFTCTVGASQRVTVRCELVDDLNIM